MLQPLELPIAVAALDSLLVGVYFLNMSGAVAPVVEDCLTLVAFVTRRRRKLRAT